MEDFELLWDYTNIPRAFFVQPVDSEDEDAQIGPYSVRQGLEFIALGAKVNPMASMPEGNRSSRRMRPRGS